MAKVISIKDTSIFLKCRSKGHGQGHNVKSYKDQGGKISYVIYQSFTIKDALILTDCNKQFLISSPKIPVKVAMSEFRKIKPNTVNLTYE